MLSPRKSLLEVQFPIAQLSLESFLERDARTGKVLNSLGKWWGTKPIVLTRAVVLAALFEASDNEANWPDDLEIFFKLMCFDDAGMWKRRNEDLREISSTPPHPAFVELCYQQTREDESDLFKNEKSWAPRLTAEQRTRKEVLQKRVFYTLGHAIQRRYCNRVEEIDGPPDESWAEINSYCNTNANSLKEWVHEMSIRRFGRKLRVGDAFSGIGSIPFAAAELGCDVYASDLSPVASLLTWGALHLISGPQSFHEKVLESQEKLFREINDWYLEQGFETSVEGWRGNLHLYCVEIAVPEWDNWKIPIAGSWQILKSKKQIWVELIPVEAEKSFRFKVHEGGVGYEQAANGTKSDADIICPQPLWDILHKQGKTENIQRRIKLSLLINNHGGLRRWEKNDILPRAGDFYTERLYCIRWQNDAGKSVFREPLEHDEKIEAKLNEIVVRGLAEWQIESWVPDWRIQEGAKTREPLNTRGWVYWHQLFTPRQLLMAKEFCRRIAEQPKDVQPALILSLGQIINYNARLCRWHSSGNSTVEVFYNQALNTLYNFVARGWTMMENLANPKHFSLHCESNASVRLNDARSVDSECELWITDPPYADAVKYEELSEFFLAWFKPHIQRCFPSWYTDSKRVSAVCGDDAPFRTAMAECYSRLAEKTTEDGLQVLMFTHKGTDVWEDLALIMWDAGLQVKQVWSVATETGAGGIKKGNYVQATYNMVLRKRPANAPMGFVDLVIPQIKERVKTVITHMRDSQVRTGNLSCGYTDTDYLLAAQAVAAEVVTGFSNIDGIDLNEELRTPNNKRNNSVLRDMMNQAKRTAVDFLVPIGLEEHLRRSSDGITAYHFWRQLSPGEKFLLKGLELESQGEGMIGMFQDLGRAYGIADYEGLLGPVKANATRTKLPTEFTKPDLMRWIELPTNKREEFDHSVTRQLYYAISLLTKQADIERAVKHLVDTTNFWEERQAKHLVILGYLYQCTESITAWNDLRSSIQALRLAVENHRA